MHTLILFIGMCLASALGSKLPRPAHVPANECGKIVGCYYRINLPYDDPIDTVEIKDIPVHLCTHVFYSYVGIRANSSVESTEPYADLDWDGFKLFNELRKKNPMLKTLASMNGIYDESTKNINNKAFIDPTVREELVKNIVKFVKKYGFSGVDLDFSDTNQRGMRPSDKKNFVSLLKALRERFDKEHLILSVAVNPNEAAAKKLYDIKGISTYVEFINLKTFDFHGNYDTEKKVGHTSPLYHSLKENAEESKKNIDYVVKYWISQGAPPNKLILGNSLTGLSYTLANPKQIGRGAPITKDQPKYYGTENYFGICDWTKKNWKYFFDNEQQVPYMYQGNQIIAYDDVHSIKTKAEYAEKMHLGGAMVYMVDDDDYFGNCGEKFGLLKALNKVLRKKC